MFTDNIKVAYEFKTSVNIAYDLNNHDKIKSFIPTYSSLELIEDVFLSIIDDSRQRARMLVGAYGRGKSHLILVLLSLLSKKDLSLFNNLLDKLYYYNTYLQRLVVDYIHSKKRLLPIIISGNNSSLTQSFLYSLQRTLKENNLEDLMPRTNFEASIKTIELWKTSYPDTYERFTNGLNGTVNDFILSLQEFDYNSYEYFVNIYPSLTSGSTFNPFIESDIVGLYEEVVDNLKHRGYNGVYIVYDEFSKYLESSIADATINDIKLLQDFAEACDRSGKKHMHLMLISHKDITNYIDSNLPNDKVDGWRGVSGRFKHISMHNDFYQMYEVMSSVIVKDKEFWHKFYNKNRHRFEDLAQIYNSSDILDEDNKNTKELFIEGCYPLHPVSTFILPRLSEKVAQNERTLFTFLASNQKNTLPAYLEVADGDFPLVTPDYIYDYFEQQFRKEPYTSGIFKIYRLTNSILKKIDSDQLGTKIIKTLTLIYIIEQFEKLPPIYDVIVDIYKYSYSIEDINYVMKELIEKDCLIYMKRSNNYLKLKDSSGLDITGEIQSIIEKNKTRISVKEIINSTPISNYLYPTRYNDENEIIRYYQLIFIDSAEYWAVKDWNEKIAGIDADGVVYAIMPDSQEEIAKIRNSLTSNENMHERIVFVIPRKFMDIDKIAYEYSAVLQLRKGVVEDKILLDEYDIYIEDLEDVINSYISSYSRPDMKAAEYYYQGKKVNLFRKAQLSSLLSGICDEAFPNTPIINNESINKNILSSIAISSRSRIINGLLENPLKPNLGLTGTGQDVSIMRSALVKTGIIGNIDDQPVIDLNPQDAKIRNLIKVIQDFFTSSIDKSGKCFCELYETLTGPNKGIGLRRGVIPIYIATVLHHYKKNIVVKHKDKEVQITADTLANIDENPNNYSVYFDSWSNEKVLYLSGLEDIYKDYSNENERDLDSIAYILRAMKRWFMSLPKYAKELKSIYHGAYNEPSCTELPIQYRKFINSLRQIELNPREYIYEKLILIFGYEQIDYEVVNQIKSAKKIFDTAKQQLINSLIEDVKQIFSGKNSDNASLTSVIRDWYESLDHTTTNFVFDNNESKILEIMASITNDETSFIEDLGRAITSLRIDDWNEGTIKLFIDNLVSLKDNIENFNRDRVSDNENDTKLYKIVFTDDDGKEIVKEFSKTDYGSLASLLLNDISSSIEEMGQAITKQEKRQVLMDLLVKMI